MQRIINNADHVVEDMLEGFIAAHEDIVSRTQNPRVLKYNQAPVPGKVGIVTGGGSGHKPAFIGYLGKNMIDAVAVGEKHFLMLSEKLIRVMGWRVFMEIIPVII